MRPRVSTAAGGGISPKRSSIVKAGGAGAGGGGNAGGGGLTNEWVSHDRSSLSLFDKEVKGSDMAMRYEFELDAFQKR